MFRILSMALWILAAGLVAVFLPPRLSVGTLPPERLAERFAEIAILVLLAWSLIELAARALRVRMEHRGVARFQDLYAQATRTDQAMRPYRHRDPRAVRRVAHMVECSSHDASKLHEAVPAAASLDAAMLAGSYGPLNVYAWVLPVLGFMGTALGMAQAISGFKDALGKTRGDLNVLVSALGDTVIPGLAGAFHVTILALGASLVVYLCTSALRDWDQEALHKLDRLCMVMLASIPEGPGDQKIVQAIEHISSQLVTMLRTPAAVEEAGKAIAAASERLAAAARELEASATASYSVTIERKPGQPLTRPDGAVRTL